MVSFKYRSHMNLKAEHWTVAGIWQLINFWLACCEDRFVKSSLKLRGKNGSSYLIPRSGISPLWNFPVLPKVKALWYMFPSHAFCSSGMDEGMIFLPYRIILFVFVIKENGREHRGQLVQCSAEFHVSHFLFFLIHQSPTELLQLWEKTV